MDICDETGWETADYLAGLDEGTLIAALAIIPTAVAHRWPNGQGLGPAEPAVTRMLALKPLELIAVVEVIDVLYEIKRLPIAAGTDAAG